MAKRRRGRPFGTGKPTGEKFVKKSFKFPPALWEAFVSAVPDRERSAALRTYMEREIEKRKGKKPSQK
jgi:hypothetical protein